MQFVKLQQSFYKVRVLAKMQVHHFDVVIADSYQPLTLRAQPDITRPSGDELKPFYRNWSSNDLSQESSETSDLEQCIITRLLQGLEKQYGNYHHSVSLQLLEISEQEDFEMNDISPGFEQENIRFYLKRTLS
jgi:hypothetical protein